MFAFSLFNARIYIFISFYVQTFLEISSNVKRPIICTWFDIVVTIVAMIMSSRDTIKNKKKKKKKTGGR